MNQSLPAPIITAADALALLREDSTAVTVLEVRWALDGSKDRSTFDAGHVPGSRYIDMNTDLASHASPDQGRHPLPEPETFAAALRRAGIHPGTRILALDDDNGSQASRLVWMLRSLGQPASLLSGGLAAWKAAGGEVVSGPSEDPHDGTIAARPWPTTAIASIDEVARLASDPAATVIDARAAERYRGDVEPVDPRAGHIPGAINVPFSLTLREDATMKSPSELAEVFAEAGAQKSRPTVVYCGSGITATHNLLALEQAGYTDLRLFPGSWSQWSADDSRPASTGPDAS